MIVLSATNTQQSFLSRLLNIQFHSSQACADWGKSEKSGENSERVVWGVPFHVYARARAKQNMHLQHFSQDKPSTICGSAESKMLVYQFHLLHTLQCTV